MAHIGLDHIETIGGNEFVQFLDALGIGGGLRLQVGDVLGRVAGRVGAFGEKRLYRVLAEAAALDQLERVDIDAFLLDPCRLRAHRPRRDAADIGMMPAGGDEEQDLGAVLREHRRHHGDVGEMRAAVIGCVHHPHVPGLQLRSDLADHGGHAPVHGAEMHGDMRGVGDELPVAIEDGAGEVEALLDVDRARGVLQRVAHLLGDGGEAFVEHFEQHGVRGRVERKPRVALVGAGEKNVVLGGHRGLPARLDHHGLMWLDDECRTGDALTRAEVIPQEHRRVAPDAAGEEPCRGVGNRRALNGFEVRFGGMAPAPKGLDLDGLDLDRLVGAGEAEALPVQAPRKQS